MTQSIEKFQSIRQYPATVDLFALLFETARIRVDYIVELNTTQVDHLVKLTPNREIDASRRYRILRTLFAPAIAASVNPFHCLKDIPVSNPFLSNPLFRRLLRMEHLPPVYIKSSLEEESDIGHTLVFERNE